QVVRGSSDRVHGTGSREAHLRPRRAGDRAGHRHPRRAGSHEGAAPAGPRHRGDRAGRDRGRHAAGRRPARHGQRHGRHPADRIVRRLERGEPLPGRPRCAHSQEPGGELHHQPGDAGLLGNRVQADRDAGRVVGRTSGDARPAVGPVDREGIVQHPRGAHMDAEFFRAWITEIAEVVEAQRDHLTQLDAAIGDADHGINLARGFSAVRAALTDADTPTPGSVLMLTGSTLISKVGGASGPLYGTAFRRAAKALGDKPEVDLAALADALEAALAGVKQLGAASEGEKTMVDALAPAVAAFSRAAASGAAAADALDGLTSAADAGAHDTISMQALKGRASYLGPRSVGHEDPGAASTALILHALRDVAARQAT